MKSRLPTIGVVATLIACAGCHAEAERQRCAAQVKELRTWMHDVAAEGAGWDRGPSPVGKLVALEEPHLADDAAVGPVLTLNGAQILFDGRRAADTSNPAETASEIRSARKARADLWDQTNPGKVRAEETALVVKLSQTDLWSDIARALDACARAGYRSATFVFDLRSRVSPPLDTPASRELESRSRQIMSGESVDPSQKARTLSEAKADPPAALDRCPQVVKSLASLSEHSMTGQEKFSEIAVRVPDGIEKCSCKVDFDWVKASYWFMLGRYSGSPGAAYTVAIAPTGEAGTFEIAARGSDTWLTVHARVVSAATQRVSFVAN